MRVAALYDIHGNLPALRAVLADVDALACDTIVIGGDVALGPMPRETLDLLATRGDQVRFIRGNCDRVMGSVLERAPDHSKSWEPLARWAAERVTPAQRAFLGGLPTTLELDVEELGTVLFFHGTPRSDVEIITRVSLESRLVPILSEVGPHVLVCGHTHVQYDRNVLAKRLINAGSVGRPYEAEPGAYWCLLGPAVELRRTVYDVVEAAREIRASRYPDVENFISSNEPDPSLPGKTSEFFESKALEQESPPRD